MAATSAVSSPSARGVVPALLLFRRDRASRPKLSSRRRGGRWPSLRRRWPPRAGCAEGAGAACRSRGRRRCLNAAGDAVVAGEARASSDSARQARSASPMSSAAMAGTVASANASMGNSLPLAFISDLPVRLLAGVRIDRLEERDDEPRSSSVSSGRQTSNSSMTRVLSLPFQASCSIVSSKAQPLPSTQSRVSLPTRNRHLPGTMTGRWQMSAY